MNIPLWIILQFSSLKCRLHCPWAYPGLKEMSVGAGHWLGWDRPILFPYRFFFFNFRHRFDGINKGFLAVQLNTQLSLPGYSHGCQLCYGWDSWHIHVSHLFSETGREEGGPVNFQWCKLDVHDFALVRSFLSIHCCPWINTEPKDTVKT